MAFTTNLQISSAGAGERVNYALFIFSGIVIFNFFSEMAFRSPMLLHEYAHYIKQTIFPSDMLAVISTLRATAYIGISIGVLLFLELIVRGGLPWTVVLLPLVFLPFMAFLSGLPLFLCPVAAFTRVASYLIVHLMHL